MGFYLLKDNNITNYLEVLHSLLKGCNLSKFYPNVDKYINGVNLWAPSLSKKLNSRLEIDEKSGLPALPSFSRLINEKKIYLSELKEGKILKSKIDDPFYENLLEKDFPTRFNLKIFLKFINKKEHCAYFKLILDRFDITDGFLVRYTINFSHTNNYWNKNLITLENEDLDFTLDFRNEISSACLDESELAFLALLKIKSIKFFDITRGSIGPLWFNGNSKFKEINDLLLKNPGTFILNLPLDKVDINMENNLNLDPFSKLYRENLSLDENSKINKLGYKTFKERRIVLYGDKEKIIENYLNSLDSWVHIKSLK
jgi:hypothetical protein